MTIYFLVLSLLMFGILGVLIDSSRSYVAHTNMQDYIDDWVLAAANELDGEPDAIQRAEQVLASSLITKSTSVGMREGDEFAIDTVLFLTAAPDDSDSKLTSEDLQGLVTTDPALATHVLVTAQQREVQWGLLRFMSAATGYTAEEESFGINTWATATLVEQKYCVEPLVAICAPDGLDVETLAEGSQIRVDKNRGGSFQAGEYGVVTDIADDVYGTCSGFTGLDKLECLLAIDTHDTQCGEKIVSFTGDPQQSVTYTNADGSSVTVLEDALHVNHALNTRLGIFDTESGRWASSDQVSIDTGHITGSPYQCDGTVTEVSSETQSLPYADCFADNSCGTVSGAVPLEDLETYWQKAHGTTLPPTDFKGEPFVTRYDVYLHEVATGLLDPEGLGTAGPRAQCHPTLDAAETAANRRLFEVAVVDCSGLTEVAQTDVPVTNFATVFLSDTVENVESFVATFDDLVDVTNDGLDNPIAMRGGDIVNSDAGDWTGYDPYAAQGLKVYALADRRPSQTLPAPPCAVGDRCLYFNSKNFDLDEADADATAISYLSDLGITNVTEIALDENTATDAGFDAGSIGQTEGTWTSDTPVQLLTFKLGNTFAMVLYDEPRVFGEWTSEALTPGVPAKDVSNLRAYSFDGTASSVPVTNGSHQGYNLPMLLDSQNGYEADPDLQSVDMGNVVIIAEQADQSRPDDHAGGGMLIFQFDEPTRVESIVFFDGEESDSKLKLYNDKILLEGVGAMTDPSQLDDLYTPDLVLDVPVIGDGKHRTMYVSDDPAYTTAEGNGTIDPRGVQTMIYELSGSGAIDEIVFSNGLAQPNAYDGMVVEFLDVIDADDNRVVQYPVISN